MNPATPAKDSNTSMECPSPPTFADISIPSQLKFLISNIKNFIISQLTTKNHLAKRAHILKVFRANSFEGYLDGTISKPNKHQVLIRAITTGYSSIKIYQLLFTQLSHPLCCRNSWA